MIILNWFNYWWCYDGYYCFLMMSCNDYDALLCDCLQIVVIILSLCYPRYYYNYICIYVVLHNIDECKYIMYYIVMLSHIETITWTDDMMYVYYCLQYIDNSNWDIICYFMNIRICWQRTMHGDCCIHVSLYDYDIHTVYRM